MKRPFEHPVDMAFTFGALLVLLAVIVWWWPR